MAEQGGTLRVVAANGTLLPTPFVTLTVDSNGERGLLGVALHPEFGSNPGKRWVYLYYTTTGGRGPQPDQPLHRRTPPARTSRSVGSVLIADLPALSSATNHNGGALHFGTDGKLYVGVGDNNNGSNAQSTGTTLGKMLRFNDDGTIPTDNPFYGSTVRAQPRHLGPRPAQSVHLCRAAGHGPHPHQRRGPEHLGGDRRRRRRRQLRLAGLRGARQRPPASPAPLFTYKHSDASPPGSGPGGFFIGCSIAGGAFYPDSGSFPASYPGSYFFADFCSRFIGRLDLANGNAAYAFGSVSGNPVDMRVGLDGALYVLTRGGITRFSTP